MPLTPSHAVVALAVRRTPLPASAVAIGAMTPDLPLFLPFAPAYENTHSLIWLPLTTALAAALWGLWRIAIAPAARDLSPAFLAQRYPLPRVISPPGGLSGNAPSSRPFAFLCTVTALALGVLTHLVWDGFTHRGGWAVEVIPSLQERFNGVPVYSLLQDGSSVVGLLIIAIWFAGLPAVALDTSARLRMRPLRLATVTAVVAVTAVSAFLAFRAGPTLWRTLFEFVTTWGLFVGIIALIAGLAWRVLSRLGGQSVQRDAALPGGYRAG